jgi:hypothetical protein
MTGASERWTAGWWDWRRVACALLIWKLLYFAVLWVALMLWGNIGRRDFAV